MITGIGFVAPATLNEALDGRLNTLFPAVPEITAFEIPEGLPTWGFEVLDLGLNKHLPHIKSFVDRTSALALVAAKHALVDAGLEQAIIAAPVAATPTAPAANNENIEIGCAYGTTLGCLEAMGIFWNKIKTSNPKFAPPLPFTHGYANSPSSLLCIEYKLRGPAATFSGENLAGIEAFTFAFDQIAASSGEIILVGASESLTPAAYNHLYATGQLSQTGQWNDGIIPGEGAAMIVLESEDSARRRGARSYAEVEAVDFFDSQQSTCPELHASTPLEEQVYFCATTADCSTANLPFVATHPYTGDMLSASPMLRIALAAGVLAGKFALSTEVGHPGLPLLCNAGVSPATQPLTISSKAYSQSPRVAVAIGYERSGRKAHVRLRKCGTA
ncbi:MAG: beta-ketoacyl synthase N-terminal-like domain-containing protein [Planctomycetota bacterium]